MDICIYIYIYVCIYAYTDLHVLTHLIRPKKVKGRVAKGPTVAVITTAGGAIEHMCLCAHILYVHIEHMFICAAGGVYVYMCTCI